MFAVIIERKNYISFASMNDVLVCILYSREFKMKKGFLSRREDLFLRVDNSLLPKLDDDAKLKKMLDTLLRKRSKANRREIINITQHNYRIFL